jgi:hypothetical protein
VRPSGGTRKAPAECAGTPACPDRQPWRWPALGVIAAEANWTKGQVAVSRKDNFLQGEPALTFVPTGQDLAMRSRSQAMTSAARTSQMIFVLAMTVAFIAMLA